MVINRHNYEEYFLLYIDGELSPSDRQTVDLFVEQNPDLAEELDLLADTKLVEGDTLIIMDKGSLYKHAEAGMDEKNYGEMFLLYLDKELNKDQEREVEKFLLHHPEQQKYFESLKQTKLEPELLVFENKQILYKKESGILYFSWTRIAIAAAVLGLIVLSWQLFTSKNTRVENVTAGTGTISPLATTKQVKKGIEAPVTVKIKQNEVATHNITIAGINSTTNNTHKQLARLRSYSARNKNTIMTTVTNEKKVSPQLNQKEADFAMVAPDNNAEEIQVPVKQIPQRQQNMLTRADDNKQKKLVQNTVYKELDTEDADRKNNIYIGNLQINKDKINGLLKRASHIFSKAKDDENSIAIANFAINKSLR